MITNAPKNTTDETINGLRSAIHHRGLWMGLILMEAKKQGLNWEDIGRKAIFQCGTVHGKNIHAGMQDKNSLVDFGNTFFTDQIKKIFEIEVKQSDENELRLEYNHCPLLKAWQDMGAEAKDLDTLCDIAMCGDRGIGSEFPNFQFELGKTLAQGHNVCQVRFHRKK